MEEMSRYYILLRPSLESGSNKRRKLANGKQSVSNSQVLGDGHESDDDIMEVNSGAVIGNFLCDFCTLSFASAADLQDHLSARHLDKMKLNIDIEEEIHKMINGELKELNLVFDKLDRQEEPEFDILSAPDPDTVMVRRSSANVLQENSSGNVLQGRSNIRRITPAANKSDEDVSSRSSINITIPQPPKSPKRNRRKQVIVPRSPAV